MRQSRGARVQDKVALVTGGASGLGASACRLLAAEGAKVVVADIDEQAGYNVMADINQGGGLGVFQRLDVTSVGDWRSTMDIIEGRYSRLDILVNNAGVAFPNGSIEAQSLDDWQTVMRVNADGTFLGTKFAIELMRKTRTQGSIINVSSILGLVGSGTTCAYTASKGTVRLLTKSSALHCARAGLGIRVNSIHPGYIKTPMAEEHFARSANAEQIRMEAEARTPLGHLGDPIDIAFGVLYLASDESRFITGSELIIDGGYTAQ